MIIILDPIVLVPIADQAALVYGGGGRSSGGGGRGGRG
jgi:hypothetical protein